MKVLLTGMTSNQCNAKRTKNTFYSGTKALDTVLSGNKDIAYEHGNPADFDFRDFDAVFLGIYAMNSMGSAARTPNVCKQLLAVDPKKTKVYLHLDDWHAHAFRTGLTAMSKDKNPRRLYKMFHPKATADELEVMVENVVKWTTSVRSGEAKFDVLLPMMGWATHRVGVVGGTMGITGGRFLGYDYCAAFDPIDLPKVDKEPGWVLATKYDYSDYIESKNFKWHVIRYGCKKNGDNYVPNEEDVVRDAYTKYWGLISHPYPPKLRGQGRDKFMLATWTNSIIISEPGESTEVPEYNIPAQEIEQMSTSELQMTANAQKAAYLRESWSKETLKKFVEGLL